MNVEKTISMIQKATGEPFIDSNENMNYEDGEEFTDLNKNGVWDKELIIKTKEDYIEYQTWREEYPNIGTYRYTNLDQKGIYYGPHIERLAANYRNVFFKTAANIALDLERDNHLTESFEIINLMLEYFPADVIPTEISYDYGALSYCQSLLQVLQFKIQTGSIFENEAALIDQNITSLLSTVTPELVQKYFPDFYIK